ncbi:hypothetical protein DY000_02020859 [Brassica cretica]|uniref:Uncharacterized protein n=1 Tax=Brassica cretica TaxID=69181 RepID=A0ABQ7EIL0_BRACR|nr:hypothetical protein DY000_02020859 [Brassica cretica]
MRSNSASQNSTDADALVVQQRRKIASTIVTPSRVLVPSIENITYRSQELARELSFSPNTLVVNEDAMVIEALSDMDITGGQEDGRLESAVQDEDLLGLDLMEYEAVKNQTQELRQVILEGWKSPDLPPNATIMEHISSCRKALSEWRRQHNINSEKLVEELKEKVEGLGEIDQLVEGIYRALETTEERLDGRCDDIYFPMDLSISALTSKIEAIQGELVEIQSYIVRRPEASASIDRCNNKSTDIHHRTSVDEASNRGRLVQRVTSDMPDTHNHERRSQLTHTPDL